MKKLFMVFVAFLVLTSVSTAFACSKSGHDKDKGDHPAEEEMAAGH